MNDDDEMLPVLRISNHNFATINKAHLRLTKSSLPKIPAQPVNVMPPVPPSALCLSNINDKLKLTMMELDISVEPIGQVQWELLLYPNG